MNGDYYETIDHFFLILIIVASVWFLYGDNGKGNGDISPIPPQKEQTPTERWEHFINKQKDLGREVLSVAASQEWIEKHSDEIRLPNQIVFGKPYNVQEFGFALYGIMIAIDPNNKRRVIAKKLLLETTRLKVGDTLTFTFRSYSDPNKFVEAFGDAFKLSAEGRDSEASALHDKILNRTCTFVFEAGEGILHQGIPMPKKIDDDTDFMDFAGPDKYTIYMSPKVATLSYTGHRNVTKIEGTIFQRSFDFMALTTSLLE